MANITLSEVGDALATMIAAEALGYLKANTVLARLINRNFDSLVATRGQTVKIPFTGGLVVNDKVANTAVTRQTPDDSSVSVTLNKHKEVTFLIEDVARAMASVDYLNAYLKDGMGVVSEAIDGDIAALYSGFSQTIDATSGLSKATFREARRLLNAAKATQAGRVAVLHEDAEAEFLDITEATNRDYAESLGQAKADGASGRFMGFDVFMDQQIKVVAGTPSTCKNLFFQRDAAVLVTRPLAADGDGMGVIQRVMDEDGVGVRVTLGYDKDLLGIQCTIDVLYGVAELRDSHGVVVSSAEA
jgi:hypothetical protein